MEIGIRCLLLVSLVFPATYAMAQDSSSNAGEVDLIEPEVQRRAFDEALIDSNDLEVTLLLGYLSLEDFGVSSLVTLSLGYHINPELFVQVAFGVAEGSETSYEVLAGGAPLLTDEERELSFYRINLGYNLLPGEAFIDQGIAHNTALYLSAGIGNTEFAGDDRFTINYGVGYRFMLVDAVAVYTEFRNNVFDMDVFGETRVTNNLEFSLGLSVIF